MLATISRLYISFAYLLITFCCSCCSFAIAENISSFVNSCCNTSKSECDDCAECINSDQIIESNIFLAKVFVDKLDHNYNISSFNYVNTLGHFTNVILPNAPPSFIYRNKLDLISYTSFLISAQNAPPFLFELI